MAEYRFHVEPEAVKVVVLARLKEMHLGICGNLWCRGCHPEQAAEESPLGHQPSANHRPIDPIDCWWSEVEAGYDAEIMRARRAGEEPRITVPHYVAQLRGNARDTAATLALGVAS